MDMKLLLTKPGRVIIGDNLQLNMTHEIMFYSGQMPWLVQSDLLISTMRQFVGVVLYAAPSAAAMAQRIFAASDPKFVRYLPNHEAIKLARYKDLLGNNVSVLELRWTSIEPEFQEVAQLNEDWYYKTEHPAANESPCGWGYSGIESILASYKLIFPQLYE